MRIVTYAFAAALFWALLSTGPASAPAAAGTSRSAAPATGTPMGSARLPYGR